MNPFIKKEFRLLLPSFLAVLALAMVSPWLFWEDRDTAFSGTPLFVFFGMILLAVDSFGREFNLGTFTSLMSQPIERRQIWRTKIALLGSATALIYLAYFISCDSLLHLARNDPGQYISSIMLGQSFRHATLNSCLALFIALAGGLWTTILLRQISAAFWITFLVPLGLLVLLSFFLPASWQESRLFPLLLYALAGIYCVSGFWLAHRLFHHSQDVAWTGGIIAFSRWRYFEADSTKAVTVRRPRPVLALFRKEFQLQSISLFCVAALLVLHMGVFLLRGCYGNQFEQNSIAETVSDFFWIFWLVLPLVVGCMAVAEERKLGVMESQFCLPVSRRKQFLVKFIPALIAGVFLGAILPLLLEYIATCLRLPDHYLNENSLLSTPYFSGTVLFAISMVLGATGLTLSGFLASSLAKNFMQALSIGIVMIVALFMFNAFVTEGRHLENGELIGLGKNLWGAVLPALIGIPTILLFVPWLSYRNFNYFAEANRLWRRNVFSPAGVLIFVFGASALIYNRAWEVFEPVEPAHGAANFSLSNPPTIQVSYSSLQLRLPDGRLWFDCLGDNNDFSRPDSWRELWYEYVRPLPKSRGPEQYVAGSNWVSSVPTFRVDGILPNGAGYLDTAGIQSDGTLWISRDVKPSGWNGGAMIQFGDETNWQQIGLAGLNFVLLKNDGTLWQWGTNHYDWHRWQTNWPTVRHFSPRRIGTDADWKQLYNTAFRSSFAQKANGTMWWIESPSNTNNFELSEQTNLLANMAANNISSFGDEKMAYVSTNGTLWVGNRRREQVGDHLAGWTGTGFLQVGNETNWAGVNVTSDQLVVLRNDGSLWQWVFPESNTGALAKTPPTRLGIHDDWVALEGFWTGTISLAADGGLWFWPSPGYYNGEMLKAPKQPKLLANVFSGNN